MRKADQAEHFLAKLIINENDSLVRVSRIPALQFPDLSITTSYTLRGVGHFDDYPCDRCGENALCRCNRDDDCDNDVYEDDLMKPALLKLVRRIPELRDLAPQYGTYSQVVSHLYPRAPSSYDIIRGKEFRYCSYATVMAYLKVEFTPGSGYEHLNFIFAFTMMDYDS